MAGALALFALLAVSLLGGIALAGIGNAINRERERREERRNAVLPPSKHAMWIDLKTGKLVVGPDPRQPSGKEEDRRG